MFKAIKLISCDIQKELHFKFLKRFHVFMREYSVVIFCENDFDPRVT